jgi:hypothetical protein
MGIMPTIFLSVKSAVMWIERLLYGVLRVLTPLGPRYLGPSFLERAYLLWTFRNFTSLPLAVLNHRQQKLVDRLCSQQKFVSLAFENGAFLPSYMVQIESDVYSQIGLVMLIGLAAKNAILIVEFAKDEYDNGKPLIDAALGGARLRFRPILMTSFAFILGNVPLWRASGSGAVARQIIGTTVIGGMLAASAFGIFLIPPIFYLVEKWSGSAKGQRLVLPEPGGIVGLGTPAASEGD